MKPSGETGSRTPIASSAADLAHDGERRGALHALPWLLVLALLVASPVIALLYGEWGSAFSEAALGTFLITAGVLGAVAFALPARHFWKAALAVTMSLFVAAQGTAAAAGAALLVFCAGLIGQRILPGPPDGSPLYSALIRIALGFAAIAFVTSLLVFWRINGPVLYGALAVAVIAASMRTVRAWFEFMSSTLPRLPSLPVDATVRAMALLVWLHLLVSGFPDLGHDSLAMHLAIPNVVSHLGYWPFDPTQHVFAVMPMNGNWLYTVAYLLGGEGAPRMVSFLALLLAAAVTLELGRRVIGAEAGKRAACLFLALPLVFAMSATLFIDLILTYLCGAAVLSAIAALRSGRVRDTVAAGILFGSAVATKMPALLLAPTFLFLLVAAIQEKRASAVTGASAQAPTIAGLPFAAVAAALFAAPPYLTALWKTGNPVFPFFNAIFKSPYYDTTSSFTNSLFVHPIDAQLWLDLTFRTTRFLEGGNQGALGVALFVLLPAGILAALLRKRWMVLAMTAGAVVFGLLVFHEQVYLRYILPAMPLLLVSGVSALEDNRLERGATAVVLVLVVMALSRLPVGWYTLYDFPLRTYFSEAGRAVYVQENQPAQVAARALREWVGNESAIAFVDHNPLLAVAPPRSFSDSWHSPQTAKHQHAPSDFPQRLLSMGVDWVIVPQSPPSEHGRAVVAASVPAFSVGLISVRRMDPGRIQLKELLKDTELNDPRGEWGLEAAAGNAWVTPETPAAQAVPVPPGARVRLALEYECPEPAVVRSQINWHGKGNRFLQASIETAPCDGTASLRHTMRAPDGATTAIVIAAPHGPGRVRATRISAQLLPAGVPDSRR